MIDQGTAHQAAHHVLYRRHWASRCQQLDRELGQFGVIIQPQSHIQRQGITDAASLGRSPTFDRANLGAGVFRSWIGSGFDVGCGSGIGVTGTAGIAWAKLVPASWAANSEPDSFVGLGFISSHIIIKLMHCDIMTRQCNNTTT